MALSDIKIKSAKARDKDYKLFDERGLYLLVSKNGSKYWRFKYRLDGRERLMAIGIYPDITLSNARTKRDQARAHVANAIDPVANKRAIKDARREAVANSLEVVANEWLQKRGKKSEDGDKRLQALLRRDIFPYLGTKPIKDIAPSTILPALRRIEDRGAVETAHRAKQYIGQIFRYAVATGRADRDPTADLKGALKTPIASHFASITNPQDVATLMNNIKNYQGTPVVKAALEISPLLFCRPGELRHLEWTEVIWDEQRIEIPASKMKMGQPHIIPLSKQALAILLNLKPLTGDGKYIFPSARGRSRPLSENGVRAALRSMGYDNNTMTGHGFRAMARTMLDEVLNFRVEWIEQQLAHAVKDANGRAYNRTRHLDQRKKMMQDWADYLDALTLKASNLSRQSTCF